ncbi:hypothetical protein MmiHf6_09840 [Methanimicrococcus hongohii]|uniref:Uncharacterized protein n=1 Tax=Methanimicrococcus hongohii TaxID=3028295 RepID=A0AA96V945_9EURY|nr:hypothetical protein [Methanimicrococcus sp. Hf6]WNY23671.1 hypothetical protein MmiHf6_09840 [Methanimicrococcus sp. Hf6]
MIKHKFIWVFACFALVALLSLSAASQIQFEKDTSQSDFLAFQKSTKETYGITVTEEDYANLKKGFETLSKDVELYGTTSPQYRIAYCDHIFVGKVTEHIGNYQVNSSTDSYPIPYNRYHIEVIDLVKGPALENKIVLNQSGGYYTEEGLEKKLKGTKVSKDAFEKDENGYYGFLGADDSILQEGEVYLFMTVTQDDGYCTIFYPDYRILLENYDQNSDDFEEVLMYKKLAESGIKDYFRFRPIANEEIEKRSILA